MTEKKIMVVDDDETIRKTFNLILKKHYRVYLAKDSEEALKYYRDVKIDLIIADYMLPRLNGLEMIGRFRDLGYRGEAILISAHPDMVNVNDLSRFAIGHFFVKPLDFSDLTRSIEYLLQPKQFTEKVL